MSIRSKSSRSYRLKDTFEHEIEPNETVLEKIQLALKKQENKTIEKSLSSGSYRFEVILGETFSFTRSATGEFVLTSNSGRLLESTHFIIKPSSKKCQVHFSITRDCAPATVKIHLTAHSFRAGSEVAIGVLITQSSQHQSVAENFFKVEGETVPKEHDQLATPNLSDAQRQQIVRAFNEGDLNHDGQLSFDEFYEIMKKVCPELTRPESNRIYVEMDRDCSGGIDLEEFIEAVVLYQWDLKKLEKRSSPLPFEWEIPYEELTLGAKLGEGAFGIVYKAKWRGTAVAVKELKYQNLNEEVLEEFRKEISILGKLRHPNVVLFMGACTEAPHLCMITEFLAGGNLFELLHERPSETLPPLPLLIQMGWQTALGLNYLHLTKPQQILHRDLKTMNLLLDSYGNIKICDFGLSCVKSKNETVTETVGSPFWMAPEVLQGKQYGEAADVYSFGVCFYEMLTGHIPFSEQVNDVDPNSLQKALRAICLGKRADIPSHLDPRLRKLIEASWANDPNKRPPFSEICDTLEKIHNDLEQSSRQGKRK